MNMRLLPIIYRYNTLAKTVSVTGFSFLLGLIVQLSPSTVSAASGAIINPIQAQTFGQLVEAIAKAITAIGIPLVAIFLVWSGFLFVTARGNEEQLKRAKATFFWSLVGGAVVIGARALAVAIVNFAKGLG